MRAANSLNGESATHSGNDLGGDDASRTRREICILPFSHKHDSLLSFNSVWSDLYRYVLQPSRFDTLKLFALGSHNIEIAMATPKVLLKKAMEWNVISDYYACEVEAAAAQVDERQTKLKLQCLLLLRLPAASLLLRLPSHSQEKKRNNLKDFLNVAGPMGVTHFLILSKTATAPYLRVATTPQGPTLTFKIHEYSLAADIAQSQLRPRCPKDLFKNSALIVLSGFVSGDLPLQLTTNMFQNIFPTIDVKTVKLSSCQRIVLLNYNKDTKLINFRHYSIRLQPVGVSRRIRKFVQNHAVPDLRNLHDVSDFVTKAGYGSESEADDEAATVTLSSDLGRVNRASTKSAVKLQEIGPRMTLQLIRVEKGLCSGEVLFSEYGNAGGNGKDDDKMQNNRGGEDSEDSEVEDEDIEEEEDGEDSADIEDEEH
ncbi:peter Pan-like protein [Senna tora]|uniref:Peter Pan-like protein n=1 Tax=Senna tora TaxID=362788 RepID=A0A834T2U5_9FABA|nr:peter Pan-like protein [Senna tora]